MADFLTCFNWSMQWEDPKLEYKQVSDDPPGAYAISGINSAAWPANFAYIATFPQYMRGPVVKDFYRQYFWNTWSDQIENDELMKRVYDTEVNDGLGEGIRLLQQATNACWQTPVEAEDGKWGPITVEQANAAPQGQLQIEFKALREQHYRDIVAKNPAKAKYLDEWVARARA